MLFLHNSDIHGPQQSAVKLSKTRHTDRINITVPIMAYTHITNHGMGIHHDWYTKQMGLGAVEDVDQAKEVVLTMRQLSVKRYSSQAVGFYWTRIGMKKPM